MRSGLSTGVGRPSTRSRELPRDQLGVEAGLREKGVVGAALDDAAVVQDDDGVGVAHGGQAVGDDDRGALGHELRERAAEHGLVHRIEMRGRLVQDQNRRVLEDGAGDGDALALAAGEPRAAFADARLQPLRQGGHEVVQCRAADRLRQRGLGRIRPGDEDVGAEGVVEEVGVLRHQGDAGAESVERPLEWYMHSTCGSLAATMTSKKAMPPNRYWTNSSTQLKCKHYTMAKHSVRQCIQIFGTTFTKTVNLSSTYNNACIKLL